MRPRAAQAFNHSELVVSWGAEFPDKLKIRKELRAWPLRFKLRSCKVPPAHAGRSLTMAAMHAARELPAVCSLL